VKVLNSEVPCVVPKDLKGLVLQYLDPGCCISRVLSWIVADPQLRADDHARYLRAQLFSSVTD
jgi:hypothetical protein